MLSRFRSNARTQDRNDQMPLINPKPDSGLDAASSYRGCFPFFRRGLKSSQFPPIPKQFETMQDAIDLISPYTYRLDRNEGTLAEKAFVKLVVQQATRDFKGQRPELEQLCGYFAQVRDECADQVDVPLKSFSTSS